MNMTTALYRNKKYGKKGFEELQKAGREGASEEEEDMLT